MSDNIIITKGLSKTYNMGSQIIKALDNVDLTVKQGEFLAITGTSGSGKSTLMHMLGGLDKPTSGEVFIDGENICTMDDKELSKLRREKIGFVFQKFCLIQELKVIENITLPIMLSNRKPNMEYIDELCDVLGLSDRKTHLPSELSGGQQQRTAIARALANDPDIVLCDEPTGNLDKKTSEEVIDLLESVRERFGKTLLIVTHDLDIAQQAKRRITIDDGKISKDN